LTFDPVRLGVIGLGRGFALSARGLHLHPGIALVAGASRAEAPRAAFEAAFGAATHADYRDMLRDPGVEMVYVATPHALHREHVCDCLTAGKHVVVEKPLAIDLADAAAMVDLADRTGLHLLVGPSHSYDAPVARAAAEVAGGSLGAPRMLHLLTATDFLYRPRRPEELDTRQGGGVVFSQAVHQVDIAMRLLGGSPVSVCAKTGAWDPDRPTEGAFTALVGFDTGATASLTYSGYGRFSSDALMGDIGELGIHSLPRSGAARRALATAQDEAAAKRSRAFQGLDGLPDPVQHEHFGQAILFCDRGDIELRPDALAVHRDTGTEAIPCPFTASRASFAQALVDVLRGGPAPPQTGAWGFAALAACHAILQSAQTGAPAPVPSLSEVPDG